MRERERERERERRVERALFAGAQPKLHSTPLSQKQSSSLQQPRNSAKVVRWFGADDSEGKQVVEGGREGGRG